MKKSSLPPDCTDIFSVFNISDYSLSIEAVETYPDSVKVNVNLFCALKDPCIQFKKKIKAATCFVEKMDTLPL